MDNKKWYKRLNTVFWWFLSVLPILAILLYFFCILNLYGNDVALQSVIDSDGSYDYFYNLVEGGSILNDNAIYYLIENGSLPFLRTAFSNLFNTFSLPINAQVVVFLYSSLAWFVSVHIYHLIVDVLVWLPNMLHKLMDKYQD